VTQEGATPRGYWDQIRKIAREEAAKVLRSAPLKNASISSGGLDIQGNGALRVLYPDGEAALYFGGLVTGSGYAGTGLLIQTSDGTDIASFSYDEMTGEQTAHLHDEQNNIIVGNDHDSGQGLARPWVPGGGFARARYADWNVAAGTGTFETLWRLEMIKQLPRISVATLASMDTSGSTGEIRLLVDGVQVGTTQTVGFAQTVSLIGPAVVAGAHMKLLTVEIQARVASGTGSFRVEPLHCLGRQS
jgi:hypothetical protein